MKYPRLISVLLAVWLFLALPGCTPVVEPPTRTVTPSREAVETSSPQDQGSGTATASEPPTILPVLTSTPTATPDPAEVWAEILYNATRQSGGQWHYLIREVGGQTLAASGEDTVLHPASVIKVAIAALFFAALEQESASKDLPLYLREHGVDGRSYEQLLRAMLVKSEEPATDSLQAWVEVRLQPEEVLESWGLTHTRLTPRRSSLNDLDRLFEGLWAGKWISPPAREILWSLMAEYTANDDLRLGLLRGCQAEGEQFYNKRGTLTDDMLIVGDTALVEHSGQWYFVGVFAYQAPQGQPQTTYEEVEAGMANFAVQVCELWSAGR